MNNHSFGSPSSERPLEPAGTQNPSNQICGTPPQRRRRRPARSPPTEYIQQPRRVRLESPSSPIPVDPLLEQTPNPLLRSSLPLAQPAQRQTQDSPLSHPYEPELLSSPLLLPVDSILSQAQSSSFTSQHTDSVGLQIRCSPPSLQTGSPLEVEDDLEYEPRITLDEIQQILGGNSLRNTENQQLLTNALQRPPIQRLDRSPSVRNRSRLLHYNRRHIPIEDIPLYQPQQSVFHAFLDGLRSQNTEENQLPS